MSNLNELLNGLRGEPIEEAGAGRSDWWSPKRLEREAKKKAKELGGTFQEYAVGVGKRGYLVLAVYYKLKDQGTKSYHMAL